MTTRFAIPLILAALVPWAAAQRGGGASAHVASHGGTGSTHLDRNRGTSSVRGSFGRSRFGRYGYGYGAPYDYLSLPFPFFDDAYNSGDIYSTGYPVSAPLPPYAPPQYGPPVPYEPDSFAPQMNSQASPPGQPLMIELQNGRYVQVSSAAIDGQATPLGANANNLSSPPSSQSFSENSANEANNLAPVVLIFKNGHQEQVRDYTIANGILYAQGDYYTDGYWNKKIDLATVNLPETLQANAEQGVKFVLPSSPNEVITRP